ncbi:S8 family serine peptidase [Arthrobacter sp. D1-17]
MPHPRNTLFHSSLALTGITVLVAATVLIAPPASATQDVPAPFPTPKPSPAAKGPARTAVPTDQFIVKFKNPTASPGRAKTFTSAAAKIGTQVKDLRATAGGARLLRTSKKLAAGDAGAFLASLRSDPAVEYAEPNGVLQAKANLPNDPGVPYQWNLFQEPAGLRVPGAWGVTTGAGEVVAVVDTGVINHPDVNPDPGPGVETNVLPGYDMLRDPSDARDGDGRDPDPTDKGDWGDPELCGSGSPSSWHGTHVAGVIAAFTDNGEGVAGVAPEAKILPVRALGACGMGDLLDIAEGVLWAVGEQIDGLPINPNPAGVVNLSLGGFGPCSRTFQTAINTARQKGAVVVVAAGNESIPASESEPANCQNVISVAASDRTGALAPYSNFGTAVDVTAPGGDMSFSGYDGIFSTSNEGQKSETTDTYQVSQGTSVAAPHVAGVAALLMAKMGAAATPEAVEERLKATARPIPGGCPLGCGAGLVDAAASVLPDRVHITMIVAAGDLNSDRRADVLARDSGGNLWLYPGSGRGGWLPRARVGGGWNVMTAVVGSGDMNGDGRSDILARDTGGTLWLYPGNGRGNWLPRVRVGGGWNIMSALVGPGDMNSDGRSDLLARDTSGTLWLYPGNGRGNWLPRARVGGGWNVMTALVGSGDMNGDRRADLMARDTSGNLWLYPGNGRSSWLPRVYMGAGWNIMSAMAGRGDFNSDGRNDALAVDTSGTLWLYPGNGRSGWLPRVRMGGGWN